MADLTRERRTMDALTYHNAVAGLVAGQKSVVEDLLEEIENQKETLRDSMRREVAANERARALEGELARLKEPEGVAEKDET